MTSTAHEPLTYACALAYRPGGNPNAEIVSAGSSAPWYVQCNEAHDDMGEPVSRSSSIPPAPTVSWFSDIDRAARWLADHLMAHRMADTIPGDVIERVAAGLAVDRIFDEENPDPTDVAAHTLAILHGIGPASPGFEGFTRALSETLTQQMDR